MIDIYNLLIDFYDLVYELYFMAWDIGYSGIQSQAWIISQGTSMPFDEIMSRLTQDWNWWE